MTTIRRDPAGPAEKCFAVTGMFFLAKGLWPLLGSRGLGAETSGSEGTLFVQLVLGLIFLIAAALIIPRVGLFLGYCVRNKALLLLLAVTSFSLLWSADPALTFRRLVALVGTTSFGIYLVMRFTPEELLRLLAWMLGLSAVLSLVFIVALPEFGTYRELKHHGLWRGIYGHKSHFGRVMVLGVLVFLFLTLERNGHRWLAWSGLGLCAFLLAMSGSRISWIVAGLLPIFLIQLQILRKLNYSISVPALMLGAFVMIGGALWLAMNLEIWTPLIGKNPTLTGRTKIWSMVVTYMYRPWLGYGYRAFWLSTPGAEFYVLFHYFGSYSSPGNAHNGFLDLWLELGFVGVGAFLLTVFVGLHRIISRLVHYRESVGLWLPSLFIYFMLFTIQPAVILAQSDLMWALYVATICYFTGPAPLRSPAHGPTRITPAGGMSRSLLK